jgi:hypothetical protein
MPKLLPSCSPGAPSWGAVRVEQRWDGRPEMRSHVSSGRTRNGPVDAAPAGGGYAPCALGRPWPAVRRHYDRLPAVLRNDGLHAAATKERRPLLRIGGLNTGPVAARKRGPRGFQDAAQIARTAQACPGAERREAPFSDRKEKGDAFARCLGRPRRPLRELRTLPRFPALRSPRGSRDLQLRRGPARGRPKNTGDESCVARSGQARRARAV